MQKRRGEAQVHLLGKRPRNSPKRCPPYLGTSGTLQVSRWQLLPLSEGNKVLGARGWVLGETLPCQTGRAPPGPPTPSPCGGKLLV